MKIPARLVCIGDVIRNLLFDERKGEFRLVSLMEVARFTEQTSKLSWNAGDNRASQRVKL